jgi:signal transduction histidine kinase
MKLSRLAIFFLGLLAVFALSVALVFAVMRPPLNDLVQLAVAFAITTIASGVLGFVLHRLGWWRHIPSLSQTLTLGYVIAAGLTLLTVWFTARMMFLSEHDLTLAGLLLLFASGICISFGYFISSSITETITDIVRATQQVGEGNFSTHVEVIGQNETAQLAQAFNRMTGQLATAESDSRALDAARRDLVAWASHDLRTPLTSLRAMLDALTDGVVTDPETVARYLRQSQAEVTRMNAIIDDLFELAQLDTGHLILKMEVASMGDLISDTLEGFNLRAHDKGVTLAGQVESGLDSVCCAPEKIGRVLRNLVENALRHTPAGGSIQLRAHLENSWVVVSVRDTGEGISSQDLPRVFERFYRGERSRSREGYPNGKTSAGAGLGLAIAKGLVEAHQGKIWAESEIGQGTTLLFSFPRS